MGTLDEMTVAKLDELIAWAHATKRELVKWEAEADTPLVVGTLSIHPKTLVATSARYGNRSTYSDFTEPLLDTLLNKSDMRLMVNVFTALIDLAPTCSGEAWGRHNIPK